MHRIDDSMYILRHANLITMAVSYTHLESQFYPNAVNEPNFPSTVVKAGDTYHTETTYRFYRK